jgi:hypothetical protein
VVRMVRSAVWRESWPNRRVRAALGRAGSGALGGGGGWEPYCVRAMPNEFGCRRQEVQLFVV